MQGGKLIEGVVKTMANPTIDDLDTIELTAQALQVSHYQIFADAYRAWHGDEAEDAYLDRLFGKYLRRGELPSFVRHYARNFVTDHPEILAARQADRLKRQRAEHLCFFLITLMVLAALLFF